MIVKEHITRYLDNETTTLHYYGTPIAAPRGTKYLATDEDGEVYAFTQKPETWHHTWQPTLGEGGNMLPVAMVDLEGEAWQKTCVRYA